MAGAPWLAFAALGLLPSGASAAVLAILGLVVVKVSASEQLRSEEDHADDAADAEHLASALERTAELNLTPAVMSLKTTHRDLIERLARLGRKPSWPVPPPPEVKPTPLTMIPLLVVCFAVAYALSVNTSNATVASLRLAHGEARGIDDQNEPVYRALAALDCRAARLSMPSTATPALKAIVTDCERLARTECDLLFETEVEELAEHLRIGAAGAEGVVVDYDELHLLGKGLIPPPGKVEQNGLRRITLATESPTAPGPVNELGVGWRDQSRAGLIPWASIFAVQTRYRCWSRN